ncbi:MAG: WD40 repeat domain-containing protein [Myxococcales bacterium]|nr:WD40 repeat domain-containing protein [Myxococcales bacterium]
MTRSTFFCPSVLFVSVAVGCGSSVEPAFLDAPSSDAVVDASTHAPPFVSAPPSDGPYALCGAIGVGTLSSIEFDPTRDALALGTYAGFVRLVDANDGHQLGLIFAHAHGLISLAYSPDRTLLATAGTDFDARHVRLWSSTTGELVRSIALASDPVAVAFVADGSALIVTQRNAVSRYRVRDGGHEWTFRQVEHRIDASAVSPDGSTVAFLNGPGISLLRSSDGSPGPTVTDSFARNRRTIAFSRDGASLVVGYQYYSPDGPRAPAVIARVIDIATSATRMQIEGVRSVNALRVSPSGDDLAIAFEYRGYERWSVRRDGQWLPRAERQAGIDIDQESRAIAFDRDGTQIALSSADAVRLFDARSSSPARRTLESISVLQGALGWGGGGSVELSPDGRELLVGSRDTLHLLSVATQDTLRRFERSRGVGAFSPDQRTIVTGGANGQLALWRRSDGSSREVPTVSDLASVTFIDGSRLVAAGRDALVVHSAEDGAQQRRFTLARRGLPAFDLQLSKDATRIAVSTYGGLGGAIDVFDLRSNAQVFSVAGNFRSRSNSVFLRDGRLLVASSAAGSLALFGTTGERLPLDASPPSITTVALSTDEQSLLASTSNGSTTIQRGLTGAVVQDLGRIGPSATSSGNILRISADGSRIVRTGGQSTLQLWCRR